MTSSVRIDRGVVGISACVSSFIVIISLVFWLGVLYNRINNNEQLLINMVNLINTHDSRLKTLEISQAKQDERWARIETLMHKLNPAMAKSP